MEEVAETLRRQHGLDLASLDEAFVARSLARHQQATGCETAAAYQAHLTHSPAERDALCRLLRITYSEFFRNPLAFALLEQVVLPGLVEDRSGSGGVRVWSAGCASGQEAWSVAILLDELASARGRAADYRIFATDLSETELASARAGVYSVGAVGNVRQRHLESSFVRQGDSYSIADHLRRRVEFAVYDLLDDGSTCPAASIYGDFDLVLCCNVMLYYRPQVRRRLLSKLCRSTAPGGYLVTGESERETALLDAGLRAVAPPATVFHKRRGEA